MLESLSPPSHLFNDNKAQEITLINRMSDIYTLKLYNLTIVMYFP